MRIQFEVENNDLTTRQEMLDEIERVRQYYFNPDISVILRVVDMAPGNFNVLFNEDGSKDVIFDMEYER